MSGSRHLYQFFQFSETVNHLSENSICTKD